MGKKTRRKSLRSWVWQRFLISSAKSMTRKRKYLKIRVHQNEQCLLTLQPTPGGMQGLSWSSFCAEETWAPSETMRFNRSHIACECRWWCWVWTQSPCSQPLPHAVTKVSSHLAVLTTSASLFCIVFLLHREMLEDLMGQWFRGLWVLVTQHRVWGSWWGPNVYGKERSLKDG